MKSENVFFRSLFVIFLAFLVTGPAVAVEYEEGAAYQRIIPPQPTADDDVVEVVEVFWYGCPHCHRFQPHVERWLEDRPEGVRFIRLPAILNESWAIHARAYYTAEALGVTDRIHADLFDAIHNKKRRIDTEDALTEFFVAHGVDAEEFRKTFNSFAVDSKVRRARLLTRRYGIRGTPAVVVNGKYRTGPGMAGSFDTLVSIMDHLVMKERGTSEN